MKVYQTNEIKNIALLGSKGSGKTTLAEAMLYECGVIKRRGTIEAKTLSATISLLKKNTDTPSFQQFFMPNSSVKNSTSSTALAPTTSSETLLPLSI